MGAGTPAAGDRVFFRFSHQGDFLAVRGPHPCWPGWESLSVPQPRGSREAPSGPHQGRTGLVSSSPAKVTSARVALRPRPDPPPTQTHRAPPPRTWACSREGRPESVPVPKQPPQVPPPPPLLFTAPAPPRARLTRHVTGPGPAQHPHPLLFLLAAPHPIPGSLVSLAPPPTPCFSC